MSGKAHVLVKASHILDKSMTLLSWIQSLNFLRLTRLYPEALMSSHWTSVFVGVVDFSMQEMVSQYKAQGSQPKHEDVDLDDLMDVCSLNSPTLGHFWGQAYTTNFLVKSWISRHSELLRRRAYSWAGSWAGKVTCWANQCHEGLASLPLSAFSNFEFDLRHV